MAKQAAPTIFRVRALHNAHAFYGDEHPDLQGCPLTLNVGDTPREVPASLAEYFAQIPGLQVTSPLTPTDPLED
jgi:hypothetical protein